MSPSSRVVIALGVMAIGLTVLNVFVLRRSARVFGLDARQRRIAGVVLAVPLGLNLLMRAASSVLPVGAGLPIAVAATSAELGVVIAAVLLGVIAGVQKLWTLAKQARERPTKPSTAPAPEAHAVPEPPPEAHARSTPPEEPAPLAEPARDVPATTVSRRAFVEQALTGSALLVGGGSAAYGALFGRHDYELSTVPIPIPGLSRAADGFTIVQLSDIHLGMMVGETEMRAAEELARKAKGDLIVLTGDLVDHDPRYADGLGRLVRRLTEIAPVAAIPGNHDYYSGIDSVLGALRAAGATVLVNDATTLLGERHGFALVGLDDVWGRHVGAGPDLGLALAGAEPDLPRILLCHNPKEFLQVSGHVALQLSGHTHGGQVNLGVRPADYALPHRFVAGLYQENGSHLYVNRGFGTAGPAARVGAPPEVSRIVLVSA